MRLTLCLIARDESAFLPDCLASVRGVVDEVVVVDTGSTDDTARIAADAGAVVVRHTWDDDFAAARNAALPHATGDYVLVLDADERLAAGAGAALRRAMAAGVWMGLLPLHDASALDASPDDVLSGAKRRGEPVYLPRLLRRTPDLQWEGRIHESASAWLLRHGARPVPVEAAIVHYGAVPEVRAARAKGDRNRRLLEQACAENPDAPVPWGYLASERSRAGDLDGAREAAERGWFALRKAIAAGQRPAVVSLATLRAQLALFASDPGTAAETLDEARLMLDGDHPNLAFVAGQVAIVTGDLHRAVDELSSALQMGSGRWTDPVLPGATGTSAHALLAQAHHRLGQLDDALLHWLRVVDEDPSDTEAPLAAAEIVLARGAPEEALRLLEGRLTSADAWTLAAKATLAAGDVDSARVLANRAAEGPWLRPERRRAWLSLAEELRARSGRFRAGPGEFGTLGALVAGQVLATPAEVGDGALSAVLDVLVDRGDEAAIAALRTRRAERLVPGIRGRLDQLLAERGFGWTDDGDDFVFVGGAGRSGTTLLRAMLSAHPDLWCPPERKLVPMLADLHARAERTLMADLTEAGLAPSDLDAAARAWLREFLRAGAPEGRRILEKTPHDLLHLAWLGRVLPRARFVHVLRDGHAVAESLVRQRWVDPATGQLLSWCKDLESAAGYWATVVQAVRSQAAAVPGRYLEVRYEDLATEPRAAMERILAFLGEAWDDGVLRHEEAGVALSRRESSSEAVAKPMDPSRVHAWEQRLSAADRSVIERVAGPVLRATGYPGGA